MIALLIAFSLLALCAWRLFGNGLELIRLNSASTSAQNGSVSFAGSVKPSRAKKLMSEAFEFIPETLGAGAVRVLVLYATEYGFSKEVARRAAAMLAENGKFCPRIMNVLNFPCVDFAKEPNVLLICSTTGDGVPPNEAEDMMDALRAGSVNFHASLRYGVLALGDRSYPHFCRGGIIFEELLTKESRLPPALDRGDVDQEDWDAINAWIESFMKCIPANGIQQTYSRQFSIDREPCEDSTVSTCLQDTVNEDYLRSSIEKYASNLDDAGGAARFSRHEPYMAGLISRTPLTTPVSLSPGSNSQANTTVLRDDVKEVVRIEFDIADSGIRYKSGDSIGVMPKNNTITVEKLLQALAATGDEPVVLGSDAMSIADAAAATPIKLKQALEDHLDLRIVRAELIEALGIATSDVRERTKAAQLLQNGELLLSRSDDAVDKCTTILLTDTGRKYVDERDVLDVLGDFVGASLSPAEISRLLRPLTARYYSISSTPQVSPHRIAITVDVLRYVSLNIPREGVASTFLNDRTVPGESNVGIFVSKNDNFRLPQDGTKPIIMIGPGTGIAPFIAFIDERIATNAQGKNILFFGCRHESQDFLYKTKLEKLAKIDALDLETAFSRDQPEKIYVQHRMLARAREIWKLIDQEEAHTYICGDGSHMAPDVEATLSRLIQEQGQKSAAEAIAYLDSLTDRGRLQRDVWIS